MLLRAGQFFPHQIASLRRRISPVNRGILCRQVDRRRRLIQHHLHRPLVFAGQGHVVTERIEGIRDHLRIADPVVIADMAYPAVEIAIDSGTDAPFFPLFLRAHLLERKRGRARLQ